MSPLGLGLSITGATEGDSSVAVVIEDYMWLGQFNGGTAGELEPVPLTYDFHDIWDVDGNNDYMLDTATITADEGYWIIDANSDIEPLDV
tara:strand:- start:1574 stop:1843 length:270 start_codon:yes stop_codon:yes gene_type:complete